MGAPMPARGHTDVLNIASRQRGKLENKKEKHKERGGTTGRARKKQKCITDGKVHKPPFNVTGDTDII